MNTVIIKKTYLLALALLLVSIPAYAVDDCIQPSRTKQSAAINIATAATTQVIAAGNSAIQMCGFAATLAASNTFQFVYGSGTNCGTNQVVVSGAFNMGSAGGYMDYGGGDGAVVWIPAGNALCVVSTGATYSAQGLITYVRE